MPLKNRSHPKRPAAIAALVMLLTGIVFLSDRASAASLTFTAAEDTFANSSSPSKTHGSLAYMALAGSDKRPYVKFNVTGIPAGATVTATLRLWAEAASTATVTVRQVPTAWTEATLTWRNQPALGTSVASRKGLTSGTYNDFNVSSLVTADGTYAMALTKSTSAQLNLTSKESTANRPPQLVVSYPDTTTTTESTSTSTPSTTESTSTSTPSTTESTSTSTPSTTSSATTTSTTSSTTTTTTAPPVNPYPLVETVSFPGSGDIADDSAIWVDRSDPSRSVVIADNKASTGGGVGVFDMTGQLLQFRADGMIGNIDLRENFPLAGGSAVLVAGNNRSNNTLSLWTLDTATRTLAPVNARSIPTSTGSSNYGVCMYHSKATNKYYAFVTPNGSGYVQQFELFDNGAGLVDATPVRTFPISSITESCVADDDLAHLYVSQEAVALWKYSAEPSGGDARTAVATVGDGNVVADLEGVAIAYGPEGTGYLFVSSQGSSRFAMYDRAGANGFVKTFSVVANGTIDAVTGTDGLDVTSRSAGPGFESGMLVVHDESNTGGTTSNLKYVPLGQIVQMSPAA